MVQDLRKIMIRLTRLNQNELVINAEMIEFVEAIPDTIITDRKSVV